MHKTNENPWRSRKYKEQYMEQDEILGNEIDCSVAGTREVKIKREIFKGECVTA